MKYLSSGESTTGAPLHVARAAVVNRWSSDSGRSCVKKNNKKKNCYVAFH